MFSIHVQSMLPEDQKTTVHNDEVRGDILQRLYHNLYFFCYNLPCYKLK